MVCSITIKTVYIHPTVFHFTLQKSYYNYTSLNNYIICKAIDSQSTHEKICVKTFL